MNRFAILGAMGVAVIVAALLLNYVINRDELGDTGTPAPAVTTAPSGSTLGGAQAPTTQGSAQDTTTQGLAAQGSTTQGATTQESTAQGSTAQSTESQESSGQGPATQGTPAQGSTTQESTPQEATTQGSASQGATNQTSQTSVNQGSTNQGSTGQGTTSQPAASASGQSTGAQPAAPPSIAATTPSNSSSGSGAAAGSNATSTGTTAPAPASGAAPAANQTARVAAPAAPAPPPPPVRPSFDIVRVNPDGGTVIAGRAAPRATVTITADGQKIGTVVADDRGEWVILPVSKLVPGNHQIAIASQLGGAPPVASDDVVIVVVPQPPAAAKAASSGGTQTAAAAAPQQPLAVVVPRTDQGSTVLQSPNPPQSGQLVLQSVDYDAEGRVVIGGRAGTGKEVRAYLDNQLIGSVKSDSSGVWHIIPDRHVVPGLHTLRIDEVDANGKVLARVESPFSRAEPLSIGAGDQVVVVQPGNNLWLIATRTYGSGLRYTVIYQANKSQIKNPDLIYPGQVFELPMDTP